MTKIPLKYENYQNTLETLKNYQNTPETYKITKIPPKPKK